MSGANGRGENDLEQATLSIEERDGCIVLFIGTTYAILPPDQAIAVGDLLSKYGRNQVPGAVAISDTRGSTVLTEQIRNKLFQRVSLVINNLQERKKKPMFIAREVVDIVLSEVL
jgi:hypothetical protein